MFSWKQIVRILLEERGKLLKGHLIAFVGILLSIPIPLMLPVMVDEVLLEKPASFVDTIQTLFGSGSAFFLYCYYFNDGYLFTCLIPFCFYLADQNFYEYFQASNLSYEREASATFRKSFYECL